MNCPRTEPTMYGLKMLFWGPFFGKLFNRLENRNLMSVLAIMLSAFRLLVR